jgi:type II secretory pathway pseudopilin PulG
MSYGLGLIDLIFALIMLGILAGVIALGVRAVNRFAGRRRLEETRQDQQFAAELDSAQLRLEDLEGKLARAEERARFTESLLERRPEKE